MNRNIYNIATIEIGETYQGPGVVIGVMSIAADCLKIHYQFLQEKCFEEQILSTKEEFTRRTKAAKNGLNGMELFRSFTAPRQAPIQFVPQGTRYCEAGEEERMMELLLRRYSPRTVLSM